VFTAVQFERRNGLPVFIQPRHVAAFEPITFEGEQGTQTGIKLSSGDYYTLVEPPSTVQRRLQAGA
jgi:hypothetical protein